MQTIALILAAGSGQRMKQDIPKQFINVYDKPVLIYTLENFQNHPEIYAIAVVCLDGWHDVLTAYANQFNLSKLKWIVSGGSTSQESIRNGIFHLEAQCDDDDIIMIHDGIRPLVDSEVISDAINICRKHGNAVAALPYNEQIFIADSDESTSSFIPRETIRRVTTPQAYTYGVLNEAYHTAFRDSVGISKTDYANTMMVKLGHTLFFSAGSDKNIKLTTKDDLEMFKAYLKMDRNDWLK